MPGLPELTPNQSIGHAILMGLYGSNSFGISSYLINLKLIGQDGNIYEVDDDDLNVLRHSFGLFGEFYSGIIETIPLNKYYIDEYAFTSTYLFETENYKNNRFYSLRFEPYETFGRFIQNYDEYEEEKEEYENIFLVKRRISY